MGYGITIEEFKQYFSKDFPYLPVYNSTYQYFVDDIVYYNLFFYRCIQDCSGISPDDTNYWEKTKDYTLEDFVSDDDIDKAIKVAQGLYNPNLMKTEQSRKIAFLFLVAHCLAYNLRTEKTGINSTGSFNVSARKAGKVEEKYYIPEKLVDNPIYNFYTKTNYGLMYLSLVIPQTMGRMHLAKGTTTPNWEEIWHETE